MEGSYSAAPHKVVSLPTHAIVDINLMESQEEYARLVEHGVAMFLPAHVCE